MNGVKITHCVFSFLSFNPASFFSFQVRTVLQMGGLFDDHRDPRSRYVSKNHGILREISATESELVDEI